MLVTLWGILIDVRQLQSANAPDLMFVTFGGILIDVRLLQPLNTSDSMLVTFWGILIDVRLLQPLYLQPIITQYFIDNKSEIWLLFLIAHSKR